MGRRILFLAEAVSLAHVARPTVLAERLVGAGHDLHFACNNQFKVVTSAAAWQKHDLTSLAPQVFIDRLAAGKPVHTPAELQAYVKEDLALIERVQPDLVVGDFRLSLAVSARAAGVPYLAICNAHWSPNRLALPPKMPDHAAGAVLGFGLLDRLFPLVWRAISDWHVRGPNAVRRAYKLPVVQTLEQWYSDADFCAFADSPGLVSLKGPAPSTSIYIGPVVWSPPMAPPVWWDQLTASLERVVYISMGSTGNVGLVPALVTACAKLGEKCLVSTAGRAKSMHAPPAVFSQDYLPGIEACARSALVVCNGGSATVHQALSQGKPVLGICSNLDQVRTMQYVQASGAGLMLRCAEAKPAVVENMLRRLLVEPGFARAAQQHGQEFAQLWGRLPFERLVKLALAA